MGYRSGVAWDDLIDDIKATDFSGKTVAVFGCGDSSGYGENFCDGIEEMYSSFKAALSTRTTRATRRPSVHRHGCPRSRARACHCEDLHVVMPALQIIFFFCPWLQLCVLCRRLRDSRRHA